MRWASWTRRHPRPAMAGGALLLVVSMAIGGWSEVRLASAHALPGDTGRSTSATAATPAETGTVVFGGRGRLPAATVAAVRSDLAISMSRVPGVAAIAAPVLSADGSSAMVAVRAADADAAALQRVVARVQARHPRLNLTMTGPAVADASAVAA
jgi:RND superfamily putative drug exporter